ncbi:MAG: hypothetical protein JRI89_03140 [Deltaproteobacteria bacterium]|nr:hypothetical protein [Deltaproteobacteria bacterium]
MADLFKNLRPYLYTTSRLVAALMILVTSMVLSSCGPEKPEKGVVEIPFRTITVNPDAVAALLPLVSCGRQPAAPEIPASLGVLFTYLATAQAANLVETRAHAQGKWRMEKIYFLDDCVAVQMTEGHYLETLFFVQFSKGWRLAARIRPQDHE